MKTQEAMHVYLSEHIGESLTKEQFRAGFIARYGKMPGFNPGSCMAISGKLKTKCSCTLCTKMGGFALNARGVIDMGASGFEGLSNTVPVPVAEPTIEELEAIIEELEAIADAAIQRVEDARQRVEDARETARTNAVARLAALDAERVALLATLGDAPVVEDASEESDEAMGASA